jgi:hypothetical protein
MPNIGMPAVDQLADHGHGVLAGRGRVAGAVRQEHPVGRHGKNVLSAHGGRNHRDLAAEAGKQPQDVALDAVIDGDNVGHRLTGFAEAFAPHPGGLGPARGLAGRGVPGEIKPLEPAPFGGLCGQRLDVELAGRIMRDDRVRGAVLADPGGQCAGVDARKPDDAAGLEPGVEMSGGAVVGRLGDVGFQNHADRADMGCGGEVLDVLLIGADVADVGESEGDDLAQVGRVGEYFLIAGQRGVEADFGAGLAGGADTMAADNRSVGKDQHGGRLFFSPGARGHVNSVHS